MAAITAIETDINTSGVLEQTELVIASGRSSTPSPPIVTTVITTDGVTRTIQQTTTHTNSPPASPQTTISTQASTTSSITNSTAILTSDAAPTAEAGLPTAAKAGIGVGVAVFVLLLLALLVLLLRKRRRHRPQDMTEPELVRAASKLRATQSQIAEMPGDSATSGLGRKNKLGREGTAELPGTIPTTRPHDDHPKVVEMSSGEQRHTRSLLGTPPAKSDGATPDSNAKKKYSLDARDDQKLELRLLDVEARIRERRAQILAAGVASG